MLFTDLPTEIRQQILQEVLSLYELPASSLNLPPSHTAMNIYPRQARFDLSLRSKGGISLRVPKAIREVQQFWGSSKMAGLFTISRQFAADLFELIYHRASFVLPLSHARHLGQLPPWAQMMPESVAQSIKNLDVTFEIARYDKEKAPLAALLKECREVKTRFPQVDTLILRTYALYGSLENCPEHYWQPKLPKYLNHIGRVLEVFEGAATIKLYVREEHGCLPQQCGGDYFRGQGTWLLFKLNDGKYQIEDGRTANTLFKLFDPEAIRRAHAWIYPVPKYPMIEMHDGKRLWNIGVESEYSF